MVYYTKNKDLKLEDIPESPEYTEKLRRFRGSIDHSLFKDRIPGANRMHKEFFKFLKNEKLTLTELRMALWECLDISRSNMTKEENDRDKEIVIKILKEIREKVKNKEFD